MQADGSILIGTKINTEGINEGVDKVKKGIDRMAMALQNADKNILNFVEEFEKGLMSSSNSTNEFKREIESLEEQLKILVGEWLYFGDEEYDETYFKLEKVKQALKDYKQELTSPKPDAMLFDETSLEGQIERLAGRMVKLRDQGKGFGDEAFDSVYKSLAQAQDELKEYKKNLTKKEEPLQLPVTVDTSTMEGQINLLKAKLEGLKNEGKGFGDSEFDATALSLKRAEQALSEYKSELFKTDAQREKEAETARKQAERQEQLNRKLEETRMQEAAAAAEASRLREIGNNAKISSYEIVQLRQKLEQLKARQKDLENAGVGLGTEEYDQNVKEINRLQNAIDDYRKSLLKTEEQQKDFNKSVKDTGKSAKSGRNGLGRMLATGLLMGMVFQGVYAIMSAAKEGMDNLAQYSGETNATLSSFVSSLTRLKNAFATAFSPILTAVAPGLNYLINLLTAAVTAVAQLVSALTGKDTFVRAAKVQQDYAESLEGTAGAAEEAEGALASFDRLNVTQDSSDGGAGGGGLSPEDMFETVPVDNALTQALDEIKSKMLQLADIFKAGFSVGAGDLSVIDSIKDSISGIKDSLVDIFTSPEVVSAAANMVNTITYDLGRIAGSMASVGLTLADNLNGGIELYLQQNSARIKEYLVSMFNIAGEISTIVANFAVAFAEVFSVFRSDAAKQLTADIIAIFSNSFMGITELISKLFRDVLDLILTPFTDNADAIKEALENTIAPIEEVIGTLADGISTTFDELNQMYDDHIAPMFESFQKGISEIVGSLFNGYNKYISPVLDNIASKFSKVWEGTVQPLINNAIGLIGDVADLITVVWENVLQPVINWIAEQIFPLIAPALDNIGTEFLTVFEQIGKTLDGFITAARGLVTFLTGVFSGDWQKAWEGIQTTFKGIWDALPGFVKNPLDSIIGSVNKMISAIEGGINAIISGINTLSFDIPDWVPDWAGGGETFGFDLREISLPRIPQLASGTVIPPRAGEFAAVLGDNKQETEVVSPLSTMKQAVREVMKEMEGAGGGDIVGYIYLDGRELGQSTVKFVRQEKKRTGRNPILV